MLSLVGVDYFSTLAYLPSIAVKAAGNWAPLAAGTVVVVTFLLALPVYWYVVGRAPDGRGAAGMLEDLNSGWRGKLLALTLLGFAAADFVITRSLSLADAAVHLMHNPHGQQLFNRFQDDAFVRRLGMWSPIEWILRRILEPQVAITMALSIASFGLWQVLKHGYSRRVLYATAGAVFCYLALTGIIVASAIGYLIRHPEIWNQWRNAIFFTPRAGWIRRGLVVGLVLHCAMVVSPNGTGSERLRNDHVRASAGQRGKRRP